MNAPTAIAAPVALSRLPSRQAGTVASMELNPAKSRVLLQLALLKTKDSKKIQDYFDRY